MMTKFLQVMALPYLATMFSLPVMAHAADISGVAKVHDGDQVQIGNIHIRLAGIDAPSVDQLCLNTKGERWTCGVAEREELAHHTANQNWTCVRLWY